MGLNLGEVAVLLGLFGCVIVWELLESWLVYFQLGFELFFIRQ